MAKHERPTRNLGRITRLAFWGGVSLGDLATTNYRRKGSKEISSPHRSSSFDSSVV